VRQSLVYQGFDGVRVGSGVGQKALDTRTKSIRPRTKSIRHLPTYPLKCLKNKNFKRVFSVFL